MVQRIVTGVSLVALLMVLMYFGGWVMTAAAFICVCFAVNEEYNALLRNTEHLPVRWPTWVCLFLGALLTSVFGSKVVVPMMMAVMLLNILIIMLHEKPCLEDILFSNLPLLHVVLPGMCIISLTSVEPR